LALPPQFLESSTRAATGKPLDHYFNSDALNIETFSTVSILLLDLAESLDDKPQHLAMAIYRISELGLMLVERSLDNEKAIKVAGA